MGFGCPVFGFIHLRMMREAGFYTGYTWGPTYNTPHMTTGTNYKLEIKVTQSTFQIIVNGDIVIDVPHAAHELNADVPCYVGNPWYDAADVVIKNLLVTGGEESQVESARSVSGFSAHAVDANPLSNAISITNKDVLIYALVVLNVATIVGCVCCLFWMNKRMVAIKGYHGVVYSEEDVKINS